MPITKIKNRYTGAVLFECETPESLASGLAVRHALEKGVKARANLAGANLAGAYLADANLAGANLADANLAGAKWREGIVINKAPIQVFGLYWLVTILDAHMQIGCELHSLAEWDAFDDRRIAEMSGKEALRFWDSNKVALLALARAAGRSFETVSEPVATQEAMK